MSDNRKLIYADEIETLFYKQIENGATDLIDAFDGALQDAQAVDAVPGVHGWWIVGLDGSYMCSKCENVFRYEIGSYCSNCGTIMHTEPGNGLLFADMEEIIDGTD